MLSFPEEILLLALDDERGLIKEQLKLTLESAFAGAVLMELALQNRIDTDHKNLFIVTREAAGDPLLDAIMDRLQKNREKRSIYQSLVMLTKYSQQIRQACLERLIEKKILKIENKRILWVFALRRYPVVDNCEIKEVRTRLRDLILSDDLPDPRDAVLISLLEACGLFGEILSPKEREQARGRIAQLAKLDFIGQTLSKLIRRIHAEVTMIIKESRSV